jgi:hypothetical protein
MNARCRVWPPTEVKLPTATSRVPAGLTAKRYTSTGPALAVTLPEIDRLR